MRFRHFAFLLAACLWTGAGLAQDAGAQPPYLTDQWCQELSYDPGFALAFEALPADVRRSHAAGHWRQLDLVVGDRFRAHVKMLGEGGKLDDEGTRKLEVVQTALTHYLLEETQAFARWQNLTPGTDRLHFQLPVGEDAAGEAQFASVRIPCDSLPDNPANQAIAYLTYAMYRSGRSGWAGAAEIARIKIEDVHLTHQNRLFNGLPMWPWETFVNGLGLKSHRTEPMPASRNQWIVMRPDVVPALRFSGSNDSQLDAALIVEPVGFIRYRNHDYNRWWGVSFAVAISGDHGTGYGLVARWNQFIAGAGYHGRDSDALVYVGMDLYQLVHQGDARRAQANMALDGLVLRVRCRRGEAEACQAP